MGKKDFEQIKKDGGYHPRLGDKILEDKTKIECLWPDGSITRHKCRVVSVTVHVDHLGRYPGDGWTSKENRDRAYITIEHNGLKLDVPLTDEGIKCRRAPKKSEASTQWERL